MEDLIPVYIVSLGPGDAGLVSLAGCGVLHRANAVFCPKTNVRSRSSALLEELKIKQEVVRHYTLPMSKNRELAYQAYDEVLEEMVKLHSEGLCVAIVAEGDAGFYSSTGLSIVEQEERLTVCPGKVDRELFDRVASGGEVAVVMKLSQCEEEVKRLIGLEERLVCHYFENVGTDVEYYTCHKEDILARKFPYFSLMIIKSR